MSQILFSLSLSKYENDLLNQISEHLPDNSCHVQTLEIALFLQKKQTTLTGSSALKDLHFKVALMYLVLTKDPSGWRPDLLANRLQDLFDFLMKSLETKHLHHVLIGNPLAPNVDQLPTALIQSKPVNLFHPLVVHECMYKNAMMHFCLSMTLGRGLQQVIVLEGHGVELTCKVTILFLMIPHVKILINKSILFITI